MVLLFVASVLAGSFYTTDQSERGVVPRNGAVNSIADPGLHFKLPFVDVVVPLSMQSGAIRYDNVPTSSRDQQPAGITLSVNYHLPPDQAADIYSRRQSEDGVVNRLIYPKVMEERKNTFGRLNAVTAIQERARRNAEIFQAVAGAVKGPVILESVQIENIDFSEAYEQSIEARMLAEVEVQKLRQNAEREKVQAEITVRQAKAAADATRAQAQADADATRLRGEAQADAIAAKGRALRDNPSLVSLTQAERRNGVLPTTMLPNGTVPFMPVAGQRELGTRPMG